MRIGILYICTGKYDIFFERFIETCEKHFLTKHQKNYYVWTDSNKDVFNHPKVNKFNQNKLGWPFDSLYRFKFFNRQKERLFENDYLFFFNANMFFTKEIYEYEIIPTMEESFLVGVIHPGYFYGGGPFCNDPNSCAFTLNRSTYFQACFFGGSSESFVTMSEELENCIDKDYEIGIIAEWHDESHLNRYFSIKNPKSLHPGFAYPENPRNAIPSGHLDVEIKCIQIDKWKYNDGTETLRN